MYRHFIALDPILMSPIVHRHQGPMRLDMVGVLNTPNTALFTSYDLGCMNSTAGNIHFQNKEEAGRRASLGMRVRNARLYMSARPFLRCQNLFLLFSGAAIQGRHSLHWPDSHIHRGCRLGTGQSKVLCCHHQVCLLFTAVY